MAPINEMLDGRVIDFVGRDQGFSLPRLPAYRGRVGAAIPSSGIVLPEAVNPTTTPVVYSVTNLPTGLSFAPSTRTVTGSPTTAHATRAVVYTATDSSTPAETTNKTFKFPVVATGAELDWQDWDHAGYGLSTKGLLFLGLYVSGADVGTSGNVSVYARPPRSVTDIGDLLSTPIDHHEIAGSDGSRPITRQYARSGGTGWQISVEPGSGGYNLSNDIYTPNLSTHSFYWQTVDGTGSWRFNQGSWSKGSSWLTAQGFPNTTRDLIRGMDVGVRFIFAIAEN